MEVVDGEETASYRLLGHYQEVDAGPSVSATGRAATVRVNGFKVHSTAAVFQVYSPPRY